MNAEKQVSAQLNKTIIVHFKNVIIEILKLIMAVVTFVTAKKMTPDQVEASLAANLPKGWMKQIHNGANTEVLCPFCPDQVDYGKCQALTLNKGLLTQCQKKPKKNGVYCSACDKDQCKYGTIQDRIESYNTTGSLYTYAAPNGATPKPYMATITDGTTQEEVEAILGVKIPDEHFTYVADDVKPKKFKQLKTIVPASHFLGSTIHEPATEEPEPVQEILHTVAVDSKKSKKKIADKTPAPAPAPAPVVASDQPIATGKIEKLGKSKKSFNVFTLNDNTYYQDPSNIDTLYLKQGASGLVEAFSFVNGKWVAFEDDE